MKIYTKTGDSGETGLFGGTRVSKADPRVAAYGDVDELNACLGVARARSSRRTTELRAMLEQIQRDLFALGARLADPAHKIADRVVEGGGRAGRHRAARGLDRRARSGAAAAAPVHPRRRLARRAPRCTSRVRSAAAPSARWSGSRATDAFEPELLIYVNRLSDLLFVMARAANQRAGTPEIEW